MPMRADFNKTLLRANMAGMNIDQRVAVSCAIIRYLRAVERFESASHDLNEACVNARSVLPKLSRFIAKVDHAHYLVTIDGEGSFEVELTDIV
jgi:hypothetical protein